MTIFNKIFLEMPFLDTSVLPKKSLCYYFFKQIALMKVKGFEKTVKKPQVL